MVITSHIRGHKVYYNEKQRKWIFVEEELNDDCAKVCPRCCQPHSSDDCDYCLRPLQECDYIVSACCGHSVKQGYIQLADGRLFREVINDEQSSLNIKASSETAEND